MKKIIGFLGLMTLSMGVFAENVTNDVINLTAQGVDRNISVDIGDFESFSLQAVYSDGTPDSHTVSDGAKTQATITVDTNSGNLISARAATSIQVADIDSVSAGDTITLNGIVFTAGTDFDIDAATNTTASNLSAKIDAHPDFIANSVTDTVFASATLKGTTANGWAATTSDATAFVISSTTFKGGATAHTVNINGTILTEGTDFNANSSSATTATNLATAIDADSTLGLILSTSVSNNVITLTAYTSGVKNYYLSASTSGFDTGTGFTEDVATDIDVDSDTFEESAHGLTTGLQVLLNVTAGTAPAGLTDQTTYYAIKLNENQYQLASSSTNAVAETEIDITDVTGSGTFSIEPLSLTAGSAGFTWEVSNDNSNWIDIYGTTVNGVTVSSVTYSAAGSTAWDFGDMNYRYLRMVFTGPTQGGIAVTATVNGKK